MKFELANFTGFSTKLVPDYCNSPDSTKPYQPKNCTNWGLSVPPILNFQIPNDITFAIETPAPPHLICSIQTTNNTFIATQHLHMAGG